MIKKVPNLQLLADFLFLPHYNIPYFNLLHACGGCIRPHPSLCIRRWCGIIVPSAVCQIVDIVRTSSAAKFRCAALQRNTTDKTVYRKANEAIASDACCKMVDDVSSNCIATFKCDLSSWRSPGILTPKFRLGQQSAACNKCHWGEIIMLSISHDWPT